MFNTKLYEEIIHDWINGFNLLFGLTQVKSDIKIINNEVVRLLSIQNELITSNDVENMYHIIVLSNILYNNTSINLLPLEDGIYDLLIVKYRNVTGKNIVGAPPVYFPDEIIEQFNNLESSNKENLIPGIIYMTEEENKYLDTMLYHDDLYKTKQFTQEDMLYPGVTYETTVTKRLRDTSHNNPELVGTLDKCKFVLIKQAKDKGVKDLSSVDILERDFFGKHVELGMLDPYDKFDVIVELKYDGISIEADIQNKRIISARTRGDTENDVASDLTPILKGYYFPNAPDVDHVFGVKFEAIMTYDNLETYSRLKGKKFANGRTAIISWVGSSDAYQYKELVTLVPLATNIRWEMMNKDYEIIYSEPLNICDRLTEVEVMNKWFCREELLRYTVFSGTLANILFEIYKFADEAEFMRRVLPFMYDGIVISYLDPNMRRFLGRKDSVNQYSMAVKFNTLIRETRFTEYKYTIGQNGEITPMIYYNPVEFFGTIHPKSSGHSYGRFKELSLRENDIIEVEYRNDVITYVYKKDCMENDNNPNPIMEFPKTCPCCNTPLEFTDSSARCPNFYCQERTVKRIANMLDKLGLSGFGEETVRLLNVSSFKELMELKLEDISHIGDLTSKSLIDQLNKIKNSNIFDWRLIGSLGFTDLAANTWKLILSLISLKEFVYMMDKYENERVDERTVYELLTLINGIGPSTVSTILSEYKYFKDDINYMINNINYHDSCNSEKPTKVRFTGVRNQNLVNFLNANGYDAGEGSVTKDTDILIIPYEGYSSGNKYKKAVQYGIKIIPIDQFMKERNIKITEF